MEFQIKTYLANLEGLANHLDTVAAECEHYAVHGLTEEERATDKANAVMTRSWAAMVRGEMDLCRFMHEHLSPGMVDSEAECVFLSEPNANPIPSSRAADLLKLAKERGAFNQQVKLCFGERPPGFGTPDFSAFAVSEVVDTADVQPGDCREG